MCVHVLNASIQRPVGQTKHISHMKGKGRGVHAMSIHTLKMMRCFFMQEELWRFWLLTTQVSQSSWRTAKQYYNLWLPFWDAMTKWCTQFATAGHLIIWRIYKRLSLFRSLYLTFSKGLYHKVTIFCGMPTWCCVDVQLATAVSLQAHIYTT